MAHNSGLHKASDDEIWKKIAIVVYSLFSRVRCFYAVIIKTIFDWIIPVFFNDKISMIAKTKVASTIWVKSNQGAGDHVRANGHRHGFQIGRIRFLTCVKSLLLQAVLLEHGGNTEFVQWWLFVAVKKNKQVSCQWSNKHSII